MKTALLLYWSASGNTEKAACSIADGLQDAGWTVTQHKLTEAEDDCFFDYDLVCLGFPSYNWHVPAPVEQYLKAKFADYKKEGRILPGAPKIGKDVLLFCTYSGPHTGMREAVPAVKYAGQFFEHFGFDVADEWYILSEFHGSVEASTLGRMGDIRGLPSEEDLARIRVAAKNLADRMRRGAS